MSTRRLLPLVGIALIVLVVIVASLGRPALSAPKGSPAVAVPTGPAGDAAGRARADLAARLGVDASAIEIAATEEHTWSDASLGLPEPDMMYAQVLTDGYIVTLSHGGQTYVYHVAGEALKLNEAGT